MREMKRRDERETGEKYAIDELTGRDERWMP